MAKTKPVYKTIRSKFFVDFCDIFKSLLSLNDTDIISNMCDASLDDSNKESLVYLYDGKYNNMDTVKLDDMTMPFLHYMKNERRLKYFEQPKAVDAICVNQNNEWFLIEFKNCPIYKNTKKGKVMCWLQSVRKCLEAYGYCLRYLLFRVKMCLVMMLQNLPGLILLILL